MSIPQLSKTQIKREDGAKRLFDLFCNYVADAYEANGSAKRELYFKARSSWYTYCDRNNSRKSKTIIFDRDAFRRMVDNKFVEYTRKFYPETSWFKLFLLKRKAHSFA